MLKHETTSIRTFPCVIGPVATLHAVSNDYTEFHDPYTTPAGPAHPVPSFRTMCAAAARRPPA